MTSSILIPLLRTYTDVVYLYVERNVILLQSKLKTKYIIFKNVKNVHSYFVNYGFNIECNVYSEN